MENKSQLNERDIALELLSSSKGTIAALSKAVTEATNPQLRETLKNELSACINSHHRLSDIAVSKGWYNAYANPDQQLKSELAGINSITQ